jgi:acyl carrier protein
MGLDVVELVMEVEETFGIKIADEEYEQIRTVGIFHDLIIRKCGRVAGAQGEFGRRESSTCLSLVAFVQLRRALRSLCEVSRNQVRPSTSLDAVFPLEFRRARWGELEQALGMKLPALSRPVLLREVTAIWGFAAMAAIIACGVLCGLVAIVVLVMGFSLGLAWWLMKPGATYLEPALCTVGGLSKQIVTLNYRELTARYPAARRDDVMNMLVKIISEQLCIPAAEITPEKSFVDDLGV